GRSGVPAPARGGGAITWCQFLHSHASVASRHAMALTASGTSSFSVALPDEYATRRLAIDIANSLQAGDFVTLSGDLGAGKTTLVRMLIRYLAGDAAIEVPSPTFTLIQIYDLPQFPLLPPHLYPLPPP